MSRLWSLCPNGQITAYSLIDWGTVPGGAPDREQTVIVPADKRSVVFDGLPADLYYTGSVYAYRDVDPNISPVGILKSVVSISPSSPHRPSSEPVFTGTFTGVEPGADVTANATPVLHVPPNVTIAQDYTGTPIAGQYPVSLQYTRQRGNTDVTAVTDFSIITRTGSMTVGNCTINNISGDPDHGKVTVTSPGVGKVTVLATKGAETALTGTVEIKFAAPLPPPASTSTSSLADITSTSDTVITAVLSKAASGTSIACTAASIAFAGGTAGAWGSSGIQLKWQYSLDGSTGWTDIASYVSDSYDETPYFPGDPFKGGGSPGNSGSITCNQTKTGLTNGVTYYFRLVGKWAFTASSSPVHLTGSASIA